MKRLFSLLVVAAGLCFAGNLSAQTATPAKGSADSTNASKKAGASKPAPGGSSEITIDESGAPKPKKRPNSANSAPKPASEAPKAESKSRGSATPSPSPAAPSGIAIDESGTSKPKTKPKAHSATPEAPKSDSASKAPSNQAGKPQ